MIQFYIIKKLKVLKMHSLILKVEDRFYTQLLSFLKQNRQQVNIIEDVKDNGYPAISTQEAKKRVSEAVESYENGTIKTISHDKIWESIDTECENRVANKI